MLGNHGRGSEAGHAHREVGRDRGFQRMPGQFNAVARARRRDQHVLLGREILQRGLRREARVAVAG